MKGFAALYFLLPLSLSAATITITNTCQGPGFAPVTGSSSCSAGSVQPGFEAGASASAGAALTLAANPAVFSAFSAQSTASAAGVLGFLPGTTEIHYYNASALSLVTLDASLITAGSPRSGYIQLNVSGGVGYDAGDDGGSETLTLSSPAGGMPLGAFCSLSTCSYPANQTLPFVLGMAFPISYSGTAYAYSSNTVDGPGWANVLLGYNFRFLEADGITPVTVSETPEPGTFFLLVVPAFLLLLFVRQRRVN